MNDFAAGERRWIDGLGNLRNTIRQELIGRQLAPHANAGMTVLDVGCGQGTQALRLAARGCRVTGVEPSADLRDRCAADASDQGVVIELIEGTIESLDAVLVLRRFDLVCAHGVLMYLDDRAVAVAALAARLAPGGRLSITVRNGHALAMRPGLRGEWRAALAAFDSLDYVNELGVRAVADRIDVVEAHLATVGLRTIEWFGVRVLNDAVAAATPVPSADQLVDLLEAEDQAGRRDPYRWLASQLHVIAGSPRDV